MKKENLQQQRERSRKLQIRSQEDTLKRIRVRQVPIARVVPLEQKAGKTEAPSTSNVPSSEPTPVAPDGFQFVGDGHCLNGAGSLFYPSMRKGGVSSPQDCAGLCKCAQWIPGVTLQGFVLDTCMGNTCLCLVDYLNPATNQAVIDELNDSCESAGTDPYPTGDDRFVISGEIESSDGFFLATCYKVRGASTPVPLPSTKSSKTEAPSMEPTSLATD